MMAHAKIIYIVILSYRNTHESLELEKSYGNTCQQLVFFHSISHSPKLSLMFLDRTLKAQYKFSINQFT